ncbi:trypsin-like peptidase domain-containing protein [Patescibacteria group bacterium]|nr:trypsin-like peptidase domain-containing protein [Patescibacteria group bacterium]
MVSFVTSLVTGIVTVTLVNQAPPPITNTINKVIEKTIEQIDLTNKDNKQDDQQIVVVSREDQIVKVIESVSNSVVSVVATKDIPIIEEYYINPFGDDPLFGQFFQEFQVPQYRQKGTEKKQVSSGTGFFVSNDGLVITNKHVVEDKEAEYTIIINDGSRFNAKVLARDPFQDVAILKVEGSNFKSLSIGDSDKIKIGQTVIAIGNALGEFQNTVSTGIISGLNRNVTLDTGEELQGLIQTDAAINRGNSGGPLVNLAGEVIGINTAMAQSAENIGFALPINIAKRDVEDAKQYSEIKYPYMGIRYQMVTSGTKEKYKLPVDYGLVLVKGTNGEAAVFKDSPADKAGLKEGDIILEYNGTKLLKVNTFSMMLSKNRVGDKVNLKIWRDAKEINVEVILEERPVNL